MIFVRRHLPALLFAALILSLSGSKGSSDATGSWAEPLIIRVLGVTPAAAVAIHHGFRKVGHFVAYGLFGWLAWRSITGDRPATRRRAVAAVALAVALASTDELLQSRAADRGASAYDVLLDGAGAAAAVAWATRRRLRRDAEEVRSREAAERAR